MIPEKLCRELAAATRDYEIALVRHEVSFLSFIRDHFSRHQLRHVQKVYDDRMRASRRGEKIRIMVFFNGNLEEHSIGHSR